MISLQNPFNESLVYCSHNDKGFETFSSSISYLLNKNIDVSDNFDRDIFLDTDMAFNMFVSTLKSNLNAFYNENTDDKLEKIIKNEIIDKKSFYFNIYKKCLNQLDADRHKLNEFKLILINISDKYIKYRLKKYGMLKDQTLKKIRITFISIVSKLIDNTEEDIIKAYQNRRSRTIDEYILNLSCKLFGLSIYLINIDTGVPFYMGNRSYLQVLYKDSRRSIILGTTDYKTWFPVKLSDICVFDYSADLIKSMYKFLFDHKYTKENNPYLLKYYPKDIKKKLDIDVSDSDYSEIQDSDSDYSE